MRALLALLLALCHGCTAHIWSENFIRSVPEAAHAVSIEDGVVTVDDELYVRVAFREIEPSFYIVSLAEARTSEVRAVLVDDPTRLARSARVARIVDAAVLALPVHANPTDDAIRVALRRETDEVAALSILDPCHPDALLRAVLEPRTWCRSHVAERILLTPLAVAVDVVVVPIAIIVFLPLKLCGVPIGH